MNPRKSFACLAPCVAAIAAMLLPALAAAQTIPVAYVTNQATNVVHMFRTTDWFPLGNIPVGSSPTGIAIPTAGGFALVANKGSNTVSRIDLATSTVTATIAVPGNPTAIAILPDGSKAYAVQSTNCPAPVLPTPTPTPIGPTPMPTIGPDPTPTPVPPCTVAIIDTASNTVTGNITVGHNPFAIAVAPSGGFVYVTNRDDDTVSLIDTAADIVIDELAAGDTAEGVFVANGEVDIINDFT